MQLFLASVLLVFVAVAIVPGRSLFTLTSFSFIALNVVLMFASAQLQFILYNLAFIYFLNPIG